MLSGHEQKEDIRLRMMDLEKKLAESEEERRKLEKTCNMLIRAFREEEKMRYKVLNKKYEKFLEDCMVRSRRNDIILRSLCRIEDRSKMLFAKTERLKLLKDRYISYLKVNEFRQNEAFHDRLQKNTAGSDVTAKAVRWKNPLALSLKTVEEFREARGDFSRNALEQYAPERSDEGMSPGRSLGVDGHRSNDEIKSEDSEYRTRRAVKDDNKIDDKHPTDVSHNDSQGEEKWVETVTEHPEDRRHDRKWLSPEKENLRVSKFSENSHYAMTPSPRKSSQEKDKNDADFENTQDVLQDNSPESDKALPQGLDGIDYQNETYPESYYEQPVHHHNHTSIASDVILEEDETEQEELEDEENGPSDKAQHRDPWGPRSVVEPHTKLASNTESEPSDKGYLKSGDVNEGFENVKSEESASEKSFQEQQQQQQSGRARRSPSEKSERSQSVGKSNLILNMLESDSESFQIEHGDGIPGNEDSDFDFSFSKN